MKKKDIIYFASAAALLALTTPSVLADEQNRASVDDHRPTNVLSNNSTPTSSSPTDGPKEESPVTPQPEQPTVPEVPKQPTPIYDPQPSNPSKPNQEKPADPVNENVNQKPSGTLTIENNNPATGTFDAVVNKVVSPEGLKEVLIPSWSQDEGQDDLIWHKASLQEDGSYRVTIKASDHKYSEGKYLVHAYYVTAKDEKKFVASTATTVQYSGPKGNLIIENNNFITGTFDAVVRNVFAPNGLKEVLIPSWSEVNGQDDLVWHKASLQGDGSYRVTIKASQHKNSEGKYLVHAYYVNHEGQKDYITSTATVVRQVRARGMVSIENNNQNTGTFDAVIRNVVAPTGLEEILVPSWSEVNGQDDLVWHKAIRQSDGSYRATIKASEHKQSQGRYLVHAYLVNKSGEKEYLSSTATEVRFSKPTGTLTIQNNNKETGTFDVIISDVFSPKGVQSVQVPIWSDKDGQDDVIWYSGHRQSDGSYKVSVKATDHKNSTGRYHVHLYYVQADGTRVGVSTATTDVEFRQAKTKTQAKIKYVNPTSGTFTVEVDQAPQGRQIKDVRVAVWSQAHQENLHWYTTPSVGGRTEVQVNAANHGYRQGDYTTHVYVDYTDGTVEGINLGQTGLSPVVARGQRDRVPPCCSKSRRSDRR